MTKNESAFDGSLLGLIGINILSFLIIVLSLGIALPWAICLKEKWICEHTVIDGQRLKFTGNGMSLFVEWLRILGLCIITLGIYSFWANIAIKRWVINNTHIA